MFFYKSNYFIKQDYILTTGFTLTKRLYFSSQFAQTSLTTLSIPGKK